MKLRTAFLNLALSVIASVAVTVALVGCGTIAPVAVQPPDAPSPWAAYLIPVYDGNGVCLGFQVPTIYVAHFADLAKDYGSRLHPPLKGSEGMTAAGAGGYVEAWRNSANESLARWAREAPPK